MTPGHGLPDVGHRMPLKRLLIATVALPAATLALCLSVSSPAAATPYDYQFAAGGTTELDVEYDISGSLTGNVDPFPTNFKDFSVTLTPVGAKGSYTGTYTTVSSSCFASAGFDCAFGFLGGDNASDELIIEILDPPGFRGSSSIPLAVAEIVDPNGSKFPGSQFQDNSPNADLELVPEPTSLAILGSALGLLGLRRRLVRRGKARAMDRALPSTHTG